MRYEWFAVLDTNPNKPPIAMSRSLLQCRIVQSHYPGSIVVDDENEIVPEYQIFTATRHLTKDLPLYISEIDAYFGALIAPFDDEDCVIWTGHKGMWVLHRVTVSKTHRLYYVLENTYLEIREYPHKNLRTGEIEFQGLMFIPEYVERACGKHM